MCYHLRLITLPSQKWTRYIGMATWGSFLMSCPFYFVNVRPELNTWGMKYVFLFPLRQIQQSYYMLVYGYTQARHIYGFKNKVSTKNPKRIGSLYVSNAACHVWTKIGNLELDCFPRTHFSSVVWCHIILVYR